MSLLNNYNDLFTNYLVDAAMEAADLHSADEELAFEGKVKYGGACEGDDDVELDESDLQYILGEDDPDDDDELDEVEEGCKGACESLLASLANGFSEANESYDYDGISDNLALESAINSIYAALEGKCEDDEDDKKKDKDDEDEDEDLEDDSKSKKDDDEDEDNEEDDEEDKKDDPDDDSEDDDEDDKKKSKSKKKDKEDDEDDSEKDDDAEESFLDIFNSLI